MNQLVHATKGNVSTSINPAENVYLDVPTTNCKLLKPVLVTAIIWPNDYLPASGNWQPATGNLQLGNGCLAN